MGPYRGTVIWGDLHSGERLYRGTHIGGLRCRGTLIYGGFLYIGGHLYWATPIWENSLTGGPLYRGSLIGGFLYTALTTPVWVRQHLSTFGKISYESSHAKYQPAACSGAHATGVSLLFTCRPTICSTLSPFHHHNQPRTSRKHILSL